MACWPTHAIICDMLMKDPLDPQRAIVSGLFVGWSSFLHMFPADSLITDNSRRIFACEKQMKGERKWKDGHMSRGYYSSLINALAGTVPQVSLLQSSQVESAAVLHCNSQ